MTHLTHAIGPQQACPDDDRGRRSGDVVTGDLVAAAPIQSSTLRCAASRFGIGHKNEGSSRLSQQQKETTIDATERFLHAAI